jgi:hypothetical protein
MLTKITAKNLVKNVKQHSNDSEQDLVKFAATLSKTELFYLFLTFQAILVCHKQVWWNKKIFCEPTDYVSNLRQAAVNESSQLVDNPEQVAQILRLIFPTLSDVNDSVITLSLMFLAQPYYVYEYVKDYGCKGDLEFVADKDFATNYVDFGDFNRKNLVKNKPYEHVKENMVKPAYFTHYFDNLSQTDLLEYIDKPHGLCLLENFLAIEQLLTLTTACTLRPNNYYIKAVQNNILNRAERLGHDINTELAYYSRLFDYYSTYANRKLFETKTIGEYKQMEMFTQVVMLKLFNVDGPIHDQIRLLPVAEAVEKVEKSTIINKIF